MVSNYYNQSILNQANFVTTNELLIILVLSILSILIILMWIKFPKIESDEQIYILLNFFGFFILYIAFTKIINNVEYGFGFSFILVSEACFWASLKYMQAKEETTPLISYINTSLVGLVYLFFIPVLFFLNNSIINENDIYILATLLLISVFKTLYGIYTDPNDIHFYQLHIYGYIFLIISVFLSMNSIGKALLFNITGYLIGLFSANQISNNNQNKFNINTFKIWLFILIISGIVLSIITSKLSPIIPIGVVVLLIAGTLTKMKQNFFDEERQPYIFISIIVISFILYYVMTGSLFLIDQLIKILELIYFNLLKVS